jgi:recombination protein RecT
MLEHAKRYSTAFNRDIQNGTKYSFWSSEFDAMAYKTMLRQILSKWGNLNYDMQQAFESDMAIIEEDGSKTYVDNFVNMQEKDNNIEQKTENNIVENKTEEQIKQSPNSAFDALFN